MRLLKLFRKPEPLELIERQRVKKEHAERVKEHAIACEAALADLIEVYKEYLVEAGIEYSNDKTWEHSFGPRNNGITIHLYNQNWQEVVKRPGYYDQVRKKHSYRLNDSPEVEAKRMLNRALKYVT